MFKIQRYLSSFLKGCPSTVLIAGGTFWCLMDDFSRLPGIIKVEAGYSGGTTTNPTYENHQAGGHRQVVSVTYDPNQLQFKDVVIFALKHMDPTDSEGSFFDRGLAYSPAIYVNTKEQLAQTQRIIFAIEKQQIFPVPLAVVVALKSTFYPAEAIHQTYHSDIRTKPRYQFYREASGRDKFLSKHWRKNLD